MRALVVVLLAALVVAEQKRSANPEPGFLGGYPILGLGYGIGLGGLHGGGGGFTGGHLNSLNYARGYSHSNGYDHGNTITAGHGGLGNSHYGHFIGKRSADPSPGLIGYGGYPVGGLGYGGYGIGGLGLGLGFGSIYNGVGGIGGGFLNSKNYANGYNHASGYDHGNFIGSASGGLGSNSHSHFIGKRSADPEPSFGYGIGGLGGIGLGGYGLGGLGYGLGFGGGYGGGYGGYGGNFLNRNYANGYSHSTGYDHGNTIGLGRGGHGYHSNGHFLGKRNADPKLLE